MKGWVKLHRKLTDKAFYSKDSEKVHLWIHLLLMANHEDREEMFAGKPIICAPGQFTTGRKQISEATGIEVNKVERVLTFFEKTEQQIKQQKSSTNRLITILNWFEYQESEQQIEQQVNNDRTTSEQQVNNDRTHLKNKRIKELKNDKNNITWRDDFEIYKEVLRQEYLKIITNEEFISEQERFHPNIDIKLSIEKSCVNYWATEAGWKKKKASRSKSIDWKSTFTNAIGINKVYKPKYDRQPQQQESLYD